MARMTFEQAVSGMDKIVSKSPPMVECYWQIIRAKIKEAAYSSGETPRTTTAVQTGNSTKLI